jgi:osomolarity two-component system sensor histidine kinase SLN1
MNMSNHPEIVDFYPLRGKISKGNMEYSTNLVNPRVPCPLHLPLDRVAKFPLGYPPSPPGGLDSPTLPASSHGTDSSGERLLWPPSGTEVLVVDDDPLTRMLMTRLLTRLGCNVSTAENGAIALQMILGLDNATPPPESGADNVPPWGSSSEGKYAIIFLDNQMPVLSGLKMVAKLRDLRRPDFVVGITGEMCESV